MANERKVTPGRYLKRHKPYFLLILALVLVAVSVILIVRQVKNISGSTPGDVPQDAQTSQTVQTPGDTTPATPDAPADTQTPEGTPLKFANGALTLYYDDAQLHPTRSGQLESLLPLTEGQTARLDVQPLNATLKMLKDAELSRICVGVLQAYYYAAPATGDVTVTVLEDSDGVYDAALHADAYGGAPDVDARVKLVEVDGALWCVSAIYPAGEDCAVLQAAFETLAPTAQEGAE
mgnify:FL=1